MTNPAQISGDAVPTPKLIGGMRRTARGTPHAGASKARKKIERRRQAATAWARTSKEK
jgi:hypothetical protein